MGEIIHRPPAEHHCRPGWKDVPIDPNDTFIGHLREHGYTTQSVIDHQTFDAAPGTVWLCECGRRWIAYANAPGHHYATWMPEGRLARWWRERRDKRGHGSRRPDWSVMPGSDPAEPTP